MSPKPSSSGFFLSLAHNAPDSSMSTDAVTSSCRRARAAVPHGKGDSRKEMKTTGLGTGEYSFGIAWIPTPPSWSHDLYDGIANNNDNCCRDAAAARSA